MWQYFFVNLRRAVLWQIFCCFFVMAIMLQKCLIYKKKCGKKSEKCLLFRKKVVLLHADYYQAGVNSANL